MSETRELVLIELGEVSEETKGTSNKAYEISSGNCLFTRNVTGDLCEP